MATTVRDVMTTQVAACPADAPVTDAARLMREEGIGDVLVERDGLLFGILTDRDIVVRCLADGSDPRSVTIGEVCTPDPMSLTPESTIDDAAALMRDGAVRRLPVVENGRAVGVVTIGDLAIEVEPGSVLGDISAAPAND